MNINEMLISTLMPRMGRAKRSYLIYNSPIIQQIKYLLRKAVRLLNLMVFFPTVSFGNKSSPIFGSLDLVLKNPVRAHTLKTP